MTDLQRVSQLHYDGHLIAIDSTNTNTYVGRAQTQHQEGLNSSFTGITLSDVKVVPSEYLREDVRRNTSRLDVLLQAYEKTDQSGTKKSDIPEVFIESSTIGALYVVAKNYFSKK